MQFINNTPGRVIAVNVGIDKTITVLPGQLIDLPVQDGLSVGLTPVDDFHRSVPPPQEASKPLPEPVKAQERDDARLTAEVQSAIDRGLERILGQLTSFMGASVNAADLQQIKDRLNHLTVQVPVAAADVTYRQTSTFVPLQEDYLERKLEADTSTIKIAVASGAADTNAADDLAALLDEEKS